MRPKLIKPIYRTQPAKIQIMEAVFKISGSRQITYMTHDEWHTRSVNAEQIYLLFHFTQHKTPKGLHIINLDDFYAILDAGDML